MNPLSGILFLEITSTYNYNSGMFLHKLASPRPPKPSFHRTIKSTVSAQAGEFNLSFYVPKDYQSRLALGKKGPDNKNNKHASKGYPCVINFHGGGFTLGTSTDDGRWCGTVVEQLDAIVVSVDYRLAPECPFPTAVEDGVDAILYCVAHAQELGINPDKIALSGFSSGGNMAITVPLRLYDHQTEFGRHVSNSNSIHNTSIEKNIHNTLDVPSTDGASSLRLSPAIARLASSSGQSASASTTSVNRILRSRSAMNVPHAEESLFKQARATAQEIPHIDLCAIVPWYPSIDYTQTREQRRASNVRKDQELPQRFTELFDQSYLHPPDTIPLDSPYLSPGIAETSLLRDALPNEIIMHTCEWDMLLAEGQRFKDRLISAEINKHVVYTMVEGVPHGWDKAPNPISPTPGVKEYYLNACDELRRVFAQVDEKSRDGFGAGVMGGVGTRARAGSSVSDESSGESESIKGIGARGGRRESLLVR